MNPLTLSIWDLRHAIESHIPVWALLFPAVGIFLIVVLLKTDWSK